MWVVNMIFAYVLCGFVMPRRYGMLKTFAIGTVGIAILNIFRVWYVLGGGQDAVPAGSMVTLVGTVVLQFILFRGKWYRHLMNYAITSVFGILADTLTAFISEKICGTMETFNFADPGFRLAILLFYPLLALMIVPTVFLLKKVNRLTADQMTPVYSWLVLTFPFSQILLINLYTGVTSIVNPIGMTGSLIGILADFLLIWFLDKEHQKFRLRKALEEEKQMLEFEEMTYRDLMSQQEEIAQLRHDYRNQMMALKAIK